MHIGERVGNPTVKRRQADGSQTDGSCPPCLPDYQKCGDHPTGKNRRSRSRLSNIDKNIDKNI